MIPIKYLACMGEHSIKVQDIPVKVNGVDEPDLIASHIKKFEEIVLASDIKVVGLDVKMIESEPLSRKIIIYTAGSRETINHNCLVIHFHHFFSDNKSKRDIPENNIPTLVLFLLNKNICIVKPSRDHVINNVGVKVGDLAARVLKKPSVTGLSLAEIAREVGVPYAGLPTEVGKYIELDKSNTLVMSEEQVKVAVSDAAACYRIGF